MARFKKGDRVVNLREGYAIKKGATGTVNQDGSVIPYVVWDSDDMLNTPCHDRVWEQYEKLLELIQDEQPVAPEQQAIDLLKSLGYTITKQF